MIKTLYIDNFKALNDFTIQFDYLNVLFGRNGSGKSTVLQALDFIKNFAIQDLDVYMQKRQWKASEIISQLSSTKHITFDVEFELTNNEMLKWRFVVNPVKKDESVTFVREEIIRLSDNKILLKYDQNGGKRYNKVIDTDEIIPNMNFNSSLLKTIDIIRQIEEYPELAELKSYFVQSDSFELMSPDKMRKHSRGETDSIGQGGEKISAFIHNLKSQDKYSLQELLKKYVKTSDKLNTYVKGLSGWVHLDMIESYDGDKIEVKSNHLSDGTLRLIGLASISMIDKKDGFVLLDEIEDGINPYIAAEVVKDIQSLAKSDKRQYFITTHSTVMLDYFDEDSVIFMWRNNKGSTFAKKIINSTKLKALLSDMYLGELIYNLDEDSIIEYMIEESNHEDSD